jgi:phosphoenolpyruvate-protein phosphotransferase (PTS system enzyme I)
MPEKKTRKGQAPVIMRGIGVSPGVVIGPVFLVESETTTVAEQEIPSAGIEHEICKFESALIETRRQIKAIQKELENRAAMTDASILDAHLMILDDRMFLDEVIGEVRAKRRNVEAVIKFVSDRYAGVLASLEDDYMRERVVDVKDVARRLIRNLRGSLDLSLGRLSQKHIIIAADLAPSDTASLRKDMVVGFVTELGSPTSHTAVMARALEIPAIVGVRNVTGNVSNEDEILVDGNKGILIVNPSPVQLQEYGRVAETRRSIEQGLTILRHEPAVTKDGHRITLSANVETPEEIESVVNSGAEGIGLFRSEYLYLSKNRVVSEDEQAEVYGGMAEALAPAPVIIRTLDIGGDKHFPADERFHEPNPFLGCRSIRLSLLYPEQLRSQLRAILKASTKGNIKIMYPMISNVGEVIRANELLEEAKNDLAKAGIPFKNDVEVGAMIEIPSAALTADTIAEHVKFFSIGTNDLIQYTIAVDRGNERVAYLYEPTHPGVLKLIRLTIEAGHRHGIWVGVCGEMAADPLLTPLLLGLGIDKLSMAPVAVPLVKDAIRKVEYSRAQELAQLALTCTSAVDVLSHCRKLTREVAPELLELV